MKHYEYEINLFVDGELPEDKNKELFAHMAECTECRNLYPEFVLLEKQTKEYYDQKISSNIPNKSPLANIYPAKNNNQIRKNSKVNNPQFYKMAFYISAAAAIILMFINLNKKPETASLTTNAIRVDTVYIQKEIPVNIAKNEISVIPAKHVSTFKKNKSPYLTFILSLKTEKVTSLDKVSSN